MYYEPINIVNNIFKKVEDLIDYRGMGNCPYLHPKVISNVYNINNNTGKFQNSIKSWNRLPSIYKKWIISKHISANLIKNSPRPENWFSNKLATDKQNLFKTS